MGKFIRQWVIIVNYSHYGQSFELPAWLAGWLVRRRLAVVGDEGRAEAGTGRDRNSGGMILG